MKCPYCEHSETKVIDSRMADEGRMVRRRRECEECLKRFSTYEQVELLNLIVKKRDGRKEEYNKEKMAMSIRTAANKRLAVEEIEELVASLENKIRAKYKTVVESKEIGAMILKTLKERDEVAYLRFASVFKSFGSGKRFTSEVKKL